MKRKTFVLVLGLAFVLLLCTAISGCLIKSHTHKWETKWSIGDTQHWYACSGNDCDEKNSVSDHNYDVGGVCICGKPQLKYQVNENDVYVLDRATSIPEGATVVIPSEYQGKPVTAIGDKAFYYCSAMSGVEIPNSVTRIGERAFQNCSGLKSVVIPESVTKIAGNAFSHCAKLTSIEVDSENPIYKSENNCILTVDGQTFVAGCKDSVIPEGVTRIGDNAFEHRADLKDLEIPFGVTSIGKEAFLDCYGLKGVTIPASVTNIGEEAFRNCSNLTGIAIPESVTSIGKEAFRGCSAVTIIEVYDGNPTYKSEGDCLLTLDGKTLVLGCQNSVIPDGVTCIGDYAFAGCSGLDLIEIPSSVTSVGDYAFADCRRLFGFGAPDGESIRITSIGKGVFSDCSGLQKFEIPLGVTEIPAETFSGCWYLKEVVIPAGITRIGDAAFSDCKSLKSIEIPTGVTDIGDEAFLQCSELESIVIPDGVTRIGKGTFMGCESLSQIEILGDVTDIGDYAFAGCSALTGIKLPAGVTKIDDTTFMGCSSLYTIEIPVSMTKISSRGLPTSLRRIDYKGTKAEWEKIEKEEYWNLGFKCTVYCTDGEIDVSLPYRH